MQIHTDPQPMAVRLRERLAAGGVEVPHGRALELVAHQLGYRDWNTLAAAAAAPEAPVAVPILRTSPGAEARRFYVDVLGFRVDWEHRFEEGLPLYRQVSREGCVLHLSEHHGDVTPGEAVRIQVADVVALQAALAESEVYPLRIGLCREEWGDDLTVPDPFGNRLTFHTPRLAAG